MGRGCSPPAVTAWASPRSTCCPFRRCASRLRARRCSRGTPTSSRRSSCSPTGRPPSCRGSPSARRTTRPSPGCAAAWTGSRWRSSLGVQTGGIPFKLPGILGHEGAGVVEQVGEGVTRSRPATRCSSASPPAAGAAPAARAIRPTATPG
ncbi:alcohol dehydrogenase catalytic domain-containing protein [Pseudonocardia hierapolitana]|uniref:alcohol dehydrogenase catalytic domain-containing protein n=1 Tax=Pseudonocardia hierapolitana TaxID=1128676 RepID=UPI003CCC62A3